MVSGYKETNLNSGRPCHSETVENDRKRCSKKKSNNSSSFRVRQNRLTQYQTLEMTKNE